MRNRKLVVIAAALSLPLVLGGQCFGGQSKALDSTLFTTYNFSAGATGVSFLVCGSLPDTEGCYGGGTLEPIGGACAVLESATRTKGDVVTREIYVLDRGQEKNSPLMLAVFKRTDTISSSEDSISVTHVSNVPLGIPGGSNAKCVMAGNDTDVYAGTDQDGSVVTVSKSTLTVLDVPRPGRFKRSTSVLSLTADSRGYIAVSTENGFYVINPQGGDEEDGGGAAYLVNTLQAFVPPN